MRWPISNTMLDRFLSSWAPQDSFRKHRERLLAVSPLTCKKNALEMLQNNDALAQAPIFSIKKVGIRRGVGMGRGLGGSKARNGAEGRNEAEAGAGVGAFSSREFVARKKALA